MSIYDGERSSLSLPEQEVLHDLEITSCIVLDNGQERFRYLSSGASWDAPVSINSCTKSVLSALVGIALDKKLIPSVSEPIVSWFPALAADSRKAAITVEHLLRMTAGFEWTEFGGHHSFPRMSASEDWIGFVLDLPLSHEPGEKMVYSSGCSQLLSAIVAKSASCSVADFAERELFSPLGITAYQWQTDPSGIHTGGFGLRLCPADLPKLGMVYMQQGKWEGRSLLESSTVHETTRRVEGARSSMPRPDYYGWHWWLGNHPVVGSFYYALGFGGQYIVCVPKRERIITITSLQRRKRASGVIFERIIAPLLL